MLLLDSAGLLNGYGRNFIGGVQNLNDELVKGYIAECNCLKGRFNEENSKTILNKFKNATDMPKTIKTSQRKAETYDVISQHLSQASAAITIDYFEGDEEEIVPGQTDNPPLEVKAETNVIEA